MSLSNSRARALQLRALALAERIIVVCRRLPRTDDARIVRGQLVRSATSTAANYRAACRAQSPRAFIAKLSIAIEEADETLLWLKLAVKVGLVKATDIRPMAQEADEIVRILVASRRTIRARLDREARSNSQ
jgi:four helix bundle protein